jgi:hypothetical protein
MGKENQCQVYETGQSAATQQVLSTNPPVLQLRRKQNPTSLLDFDCVQTLCISEKDSAYDTE